MVGDVNVHGKQDFASDEASVGRVMERVQLLIGKVGDYCGAVVEGIAQELNYGVLVGRGRQVRRGQNL